MRIGVRVNGAGGFSRVVNLPWGDLVFARERGAGLVFRRDGDRAALKRTDLDGHQPPRGGHLLDTPFQFVALDSPAADSEGGGGAEDPFAQSARVASVSMLSTVPGRPFSSRRAC